MSIALIEALSEPLELEGRRQFSGWDAELFQQLCRGPARQLGQRLKGRQGTDRVLAAYLRLAVEGVGLGYIDRQSFDALIRDGKDISAAPNLVALFWLLLLPAKLPDCDVDAQVSLLVDLWNLSEGLLNEPPWLNRYVTSSAAALTDLRDIEGFLVRVLEPALSPVTGARLEGPFGLTVMDTSQVEEDFLPGEMHLAAPAVLCVHDRKREAIRIGMFLKSEQKSQFLGLVPCLGPGPEQERLPAFSVGDRAASIGDKTVTLPMLRRSHQAVLAASGFLVVSAEDSQRLWVVESP